MKQLIMKDIRLLRYINLVMLCVGILFGYVGLKAENIYMSKLIYEFAMFIMIYITSMYFTQYDVKGKIDLMLNSLPVDRYDIVKSRYISLMVYIVSIPLITFISSNIFSIIFRKTVVGSSATIWDVLFVWGLSLVIFSIYLPIHYYSIGKAQIFNQIFYILLIILPNVVGRFGSKIENTGIFQRIISLNFRTIILIFVSIGAIMYLISLQMSKNIYKGKEF